MKNNICNYFYRGVYIVETIEGDPGGENKHQTLTSPQQQTQEQQAQLLLQTIEQSGEMITGPQQFVLQTLEESGNQSYVIQAPQYVIQQVVQKPGHPPQIINQYVDNRKSPHNQKQFMIHPQVDMSQQNQQNQIDPNNQNQNQNQNQPKVVTQQLENSMQQPFLLQQLESNKQQQIFMMQHVETLKNQQFAMQQMEANKQNQNFVQNADENNQNQQQRLQQMESNKASQQVQFVPVKNLPPQAVMQQINKANQQQGPQQQSQYVLSQFQGNKQPQLQQSQQQQSLQSQQQQPQLPQSQQQPHQQHIVLRHVDGHFIFQPQKVLFISYLRKKNFYVIISFTIFLVCFLGRGKYSGPREYGKATAVTSATFGS